MAQRQFPLRKKVQTENSTSAAPAQTDELEKQYVFQLLRTHESQKPRDSKTGELAGSPYQPFYAVVNSGLAWDSEYVPPTEAKKPKADQKKGGTRRWRFLHNFPTIWVDEQVDPEPTRDELAAAENDIVFRQGFLRVSGHEVMKLKALKLNNGFQDCERPLKNVTKEYMLLDQDKIDKEVLQHLDDSFEAEKCAREATVEEMYAVGYYFGIDMSKSDDAIRKEFISKARSNPKLFNREFVNPKNKYKYRFMCALDDNIISGTIVPTKLYYVESNTPILDLKTTDIAEELATNAMANSEKYINLYNKLEKMYQEEA